MGRSETAIRLPSPKEMEPRAHDGIRVSPDHAVRADAGAGGRPAAAAPALAQSAVAARAAVAAARAAGRAGVAGRNALAGRWPEPGVRQPASHLERAAERPGRPG